MNTIRATVDAAIQCLHTHGAAMDRPWSMEINIGNPHFPQPDHVAFSEYHGHGVRASGFVIRKNKWKYIHNSEAPHQLFNIEADRDELHNCIEEEPDIAADLEVELRKICNPERENQRADDHTEKQLEAIKKADLEFLPGGHATYAPDP